MKLKLFTTIGLLTTASFVAPVKAQDAQPVKAVTPQAQVSGDQVLEACSQDRADTLPIPFSDLSPSDWAFKAVMSLYYCGAYHGAIPLERVKPFFQRQAPQSSSNQTPTQRNLI
jgi:hypothetical protein